MTLDELYDWTEQQLGGTHTVRTVEALRDVCAELKEDADHRRRLEEDYEAQRWEWDNQETALRNTIQDLEDELAALRQHQQRDRQAPP